MYECPLRVPQIRGIRWALKLHVCMWRAYVIGVETARMSIRNVSCNLVLRGTEIQADENRRGGHRKRDINFILRRRNQFIINRNNRYYPPQIFVESPTGFCLPFDVRKFHGDVTMEVRRMWDDFVGVDGVPRMTAGITSAT